MKKLSLNKEVIANLNSEMMKRLNGGSDQPAPTIGCNSRRNSCNVTYTCVTNFYCVPTELPPCGY